MCKRRCVGVMLALAAFSAMAGLVRAEDELWMTDFEAAKAKAKAEKKMLLVDCTGSDWCGFCKKLKSDVFDTEEFKAAAQKQYVLVELDYPKNKEQSDKLKEQNKALKEKYKIRGYPAILLLDAEGQLLVKVGGYRPGGPEKYLAHLADGLKTYEDVVKMRKELDGSAGLDRAKLLDKLIDGYVKIGNEIDEIEAWDKEIIALDADNQAGLKTKHEVRMITVQVEKLVKAKQADEAMAALDKALELPGITAQQKQDLYFSRGSVCLMKRDLVGVVDCLEKALKAAPNGAKAKTIKALIQRFKPMAEKSGKGNGKAKGKAKAAKKVD